jgi:hypothetical protein
MLMPLFSCVLEHDSQPSKLIDHYCVKENKGGIICPIFITNVGEPQQKHSESCGELVLFVELILYTFFDWAIGYDHFFWGCGEFCCMCR